jgi:hypothetical protein
MTNVYELITQQILQQLEAGTVPWRPSWRGGEAGMPRNLVSGRPYRGINVWLLALAGYGSPYWLTFRQAQERGGQVRKGEKGQRVVLWRWRDRKTEDGETERIPHLRYYTVFNAEQVDGLEAVPTLEPATYEHAPLAECEALIDGMEHPPWMLSCTDSSVARFSMPMATWTRLDAVLRRQYAYLTDEHECYSLGEYTSGAGYQHSETNQLIANSAPLYTVHLTHPGGRTIPWNQASQLVQQ